MTVDVVVRSLSCHSELYSKPTGPGLPLASLAESKLASLLVGGLLYIVLGDIMIFIDIDDIHIKQY